MGYVYILANASRSTLYIGVTSNLPRRLYEHKNKLIDGFTKTFHIHDLMYVEVYPHIEEAIRREKQLKGWTRKKKTALISARNPLWKDISQEWT